MGKLSYRDIEEIGEDLPGQLMVELEIKPRNVES
jgi:hypothetical protein